MTISRDSRSASALVLYRLHGCPYCERIVELLDRYELDYDSRYVHPTHSRRNAVKRLSGGRGVPVLVDEDAGVTMAESAAIASYLERTYGGGA